MASNTTPSRRATVRTYRHGLGDCHLLTLYGAGDATYRILIDCGVILGTENAASKMTQVMDDVVLASGGKVDLLVATHKHWDHVSGFMQASAAFAKLAVGEVWMAWTEDPQDAQAKSLQADHDQALAMLQGVAARMQMDDPDNDHALNDLLGFFGAAARVTTQTALDAVRAKGKGTVRYCDPKDAPRDLPAFGAHIYVLGPPRDETRLKNMSPPSSAQDKTTYKMALDSYHRYIADAIGADEAQLPFARPYNIPVQVAQSVPFFQQRYWNQEDWRRIDDGWLDDATGLALQLDNVVNNTSLVLAIDLQEAGVLLFAADAQVGNWLSWGDCKWTLPEGETVSGHDLVSRTTFYKVGHHGSPNATLREGGLELMTQLNVAVVPVDHDMALKRRWGSLPLDSLMKALDQLTAPRGFSLRTDTNPGALAVQRGVRSTALYFEIDV
ncbi:hypothetical protein [Pseudomonas sp. NA-150]|uniref:hypothetical protein n=1 Tax=Pseudomonas sp. NA-150 TaxID=3367525 RepID=UPI0037C9DCB6